MQTRVLLTAAAIRGRVAELGAEISRWAKPLPAAPTVLWLADGALVFAADLIREIGAGIFVESVRASSYGAGLSSSGEVSLGGDFSRFAGRDVLLVDDIFDTGLTLETVRRKLEAAGAKSVLTCVLLRKIGRETARGARPPDFVGFEIPDKFVFGYGLDMSGKCRNLKQIEYIK